MPLVDLICLASSTKLGGRCVAGLRVDGKGWVRPIAPDTKHGELYSRHFGLPGGGEPEVLDLIAVDLAKYQPSPDQPENWTIGPVPWTLKRRPALPELRPVLRAGLVLGPALLGSTNKAELARVESRALSSLALVAPSNLRWVLDNDIRGRPQPRVLFQLRGQQYNLPITDPAWTSRITRTLSPLEPELYPQEVIGISKYSRIWLTISLSEPFEGRCYKLAAAIIVMDS